MVKTRRRGAVQSNADGHASSGDNSSRRNKDDDGGDDDAVELGDLLAEGIFVPGRELSIVSADGRAVLYSAVLARDGWLADPHGAERYPDVASWVHTLLQSHDPRTRAARKGLRAVVRAARASAGGEGGAGDDEDAAEERCLWRCVHAGADGTLAEVRAAFCEWRRQQRRPPAPHEPEAKRCRDGGGSDCDGDSENGSDAATVNPADANELSQGTTTTAATTSTTATGSGPSSSFLPCTQVLSPRPHDDGGKEDDGNEDNAETLEAVASTLDPRELLFPGDGDGAACSAAPPLYGEARSLDAPVPPSVNAPEGTAAPAAAAAAPQTAASTDADDLSQFSVPEPTQLAAAVVPEAKPEEAKPEEAKREETETRPGPTVVASCLPPELLRHLAVAVKKLGGATRGTFDARAVTHVVVPADGSAPAGGPVTRVRTSKLAQGVLAGRWVVAFEWVLDSFAAGRWLPEARYAVRPARDAPSPVLAARRALAAGAGPLLRGVQLFVAPGTPRALAAALAEIAAAGGATVLAHAPPPPATAAELLAPSAVLVLAPRATTPPAAAEQLYVDTGRRPVACDYVLDCVCAYALLPTPPYELELPRDRDALSLLDDVEPSLQL